MKKEPWSEEQRDDEGQLDFFTGKYHGADPTPTERESGEAIEKRERGPLKRNSAGHIVLRVYGDGERRTAYDASWEAAIAQGEEGDWHSRRRESERLLKRGYLVKDGEMRNRSPRGRPNVDAFRITAAGLNALAGLEAR